MLRTFLIFDLLVGAVIALAAVVFYLLLPPDEQARIRFAIRRLLSK